MRAFYLSDADNLTAALTSEKTTINRHFYCADLYEDILEDLQDSSLFVSFTTDAAINHDVKVSDINGVYIHTAAGVITACQNTLKEPTKTDLIDITRKLWYQHCSHYEGVFDVVISIDKNGTNSEFKKQLKAYHSLDAAVYALYFAVGYMKSDRHSVDRQVYCCANKHTQIKVGIGRVNYSVVAVNRLA